jgi:imidazole glycerol-phosphate synthase subunit HisH
MVTIVDYGVGNLSSILNMLRRIDVRTELSSDPVHIAAADRLILPGVGAFDAAMTTLRARGLEAPIREAVITRKRPLLGICLGMQLLLDGSAEGQERGLGLIPGRCEKFTPPADSKLRVPHMGWNEVQPAQPSTLFEERASELLFSDLEPKLQSFYFVHSYFAVPKDRACVLGTTTHGETFASMLVRDNVYGAQFHPEKSHKFGMRLFKNFAEIV